MVRNVVWDTVYIGVFDSQIAYNHYRRGASPFLATQLLGE